MEKEGYIGKFDQNEIQKLPYFGPTSRRIYVVVKTGTATTIRELFVQRTDAFTTNLLGLLNSLKSGEILEIRYSCGFDSFIRINLTREGNLVGEYFGNSENSFRELKMKLRTKMGP